MGFSPPASPNPRKAPASSAPLAWGLATPEPNPPRGELCSWWPGPLLTSLTRQQIPGHRHHWLSHTKNLTQSRDAVQDCFGILSELRSSKLSQTRTHRQVVAPKWINQEVRSTHTTAGPATAVLRVCKTLYLKKKEVLSYFQKLFFNILLQKLFS